MKKRSEVTRLKDRIAYLNSEIKALEAQKQKIVNDREKFRTFFLKELRLQIEVNGERKYYAASTMIERLSQFLGKVESWYWP